VEQRRLDGYLEILKRNPDCFRAVKKCMDRYEAWEDRMYLAVWAPSMVEYVIWILQQAREKHIQRLYFLSRDAYPMYIAAKELADTLESGIDCRYLRVSRYSLRLPEYHLLGKDCLDRIFLSGIDVSMRIILGRAGLSENEMRTVCREAGYEKNLDAVLNRREILEQREIFREKSQSLYPYIEAHSREAFPSCIGYLRQEGLLEDVRWAVVDSGWVGTIQKSIHNILAAEKPDVEVEGFYFGLYELPGDRTGCKYHSYYFAPAGSILRKVSFSNCLYEIIYSEPSPMVEAYTGEDQRYMPVFSKTNNRNSSQLQRNAGILCDFTAEYLDISRQSGYRELKGVENGAFRPVAGRLYPRLMGNPSRLEAGYYGSFLFSDDLCDAHIRKAANELTEQELKDAGAVSKLLIMAGISRKVIHESAWIEGSIVNLNQHVHRNLRRAKRAKWLTCVRQSIKAMKG
jgi:hypothetical protein